ncbi:hypothetical protein QEN19_001828 [Hanseniaspora menglaensis]
MDKVESEELEPLTQLDSFFGEEENHVSSHTASVLNETKLKTFGNITTSSYKNSDLEDRAITQFSKPHSVNNVIKSTKFLELEREVDDNRRQIKLQEKKILFLEMEFKKLTELMQTNKNGISLNAPSNDTQNILAEINSNDDASEKVFEQLKYDIFELVAKIESDKVKFWPSYPKSVNLCDQRMCIFNAELIDEIYYVNTSIPNNSLEKFVKMSHFNFIFSVLKMSNMKQFSKFVVEKQELVNFNPKEAIIEIIDILDDATDANLKFLGLILQINWLMATGNFSLSDPVCLSYFCMFAANTISNINVDELLYIFKIFSDDLVLRLVQYFSWDVLFGKTNIGTFDDLCFEFDNLQTYPSQFNHYARFLMYRQKLLLYDSWNDDYLMVKSFLENEFDFSRYEIHFGEKTIKPRKETLYNLAEKKDQYANGRFSKIEMKEYIKQKRHNSRVLGKLTEAKFYIEHKIKYLNLFSRVIYLINNHNLFHIFSRYFTIFLKESVPYKPQLDITTFFPELEATIANKNFKNGKPILTAKLFSDNFNFMSKSNFGMYDKYLYSEEFTAPFKTIIKHDPLLFDYSMDIMLVQSKMTIRVKGFQFLNETLKPVSLQDTSLWDQERLSSNVNEKIDSKNREMIKNSKKHKNTSTTQGKSIKDPQYEQNNNTSKVSVNNKSKAIKKQFNDDLKKRTFTGTKNLKGAYYSTTKVIEKNNTSSNNFRAKNGFFDTISDNKSERDVSALQGNRFNKERPPYDNNKQMYSKNDQKKHALKVKSDLKRKPRKKKYPLFDKDSHIAKEDI